MLQSHESCENGGDGVIRGFRLADFFVADSGVSATTGVTTMTVVLPSLRDLKPFNVTPVGRDERLGVVTTRGRGPLLCVSLCLDVFALRSSATSIGSRLAGRRLSDSLLLLCGLVPFFCPCWTLAISIAVFGIAVWKSDGLALLGPARARQPGSYTVLRGGGSGRVGLML